MQDSATATVKALPAKKIADHHFEVPAVRAVHGRPEDRLELLDRRVERRLSFGAAFRARSQVELDLPQDGKNRGGDRNRAPSTIGRRQAGRAYRRLIRFGRSLSTRAGTSRRRRCAPPADRESRRRTSASSHAAGRAARRSPSVRARSTSLARCRSGCRAASRRAAPSPGAD